MAVEQPTKRWYEPIARFGKGTLELVCHTAMVILILWAIRAVEWTVEYLWGSKELLLFDRFPLRYVFHGSDSFLLLGFSTVGVFLILRAYFGK
jgi:hypothetical protein